MPDKMRMDIKLPDGNTDTVVYDGKVVWMLGDLMFGGGGSMGRQVMKLDIASLAQDENLADATEGMAFSPEEILFLCKGLTILRKT